MNLAKASERSTFESPRQREGDDGKSKCDVIAHVCTSIWPRLDSRLRLYTIKKRMSRSTRPSSMRRRIPHLPPIPTSSARMEQKGIPHNCRNYHPPFRSRYHPNPGNISIVPLYHQWSMTNLDRKSSSSIITFSRIDISLNRLRLSRSARTPSPYHTKVTYRVVIKLNKG